MIRFVTRTFFSLIALAALAGTAQAAFVPATWTDEYITNQDVIHGVIDADYQHDITYDGFNVGSDIVTDFLLTIDLYDDVSDRFLEGELAFVNLPGILGDRFVSSFQFGDGAYVGASVVGLFELNLLGQLSVTISAVYGDFVLTGSHLVANGLQQVASVPEPGTLGLLGLGLLGIAAGTRRRSAARG